MPHGASRDFSGLNTRLVLDHVRAVLGADGVAALLSGAQEDRPIELLLDDTTWSSYGQFRRLLETAARLLASHGGLEVMAGLPSLGSNPSPELARMMQALGSPLAVALTTTDAAPSLYPLLAMSVEVLAPTHVRFHRRVLADHEPFPELCAFFIGLVPRTVRLFGLRVLDVREVHCQLRGDEDCVTELRWDETADLAVQRDLMRMRMEIAESRLEGFQQTVNDIVSADDLGAVLTRIVQSAARATTAPGFVLSVDALPRGTGIFADGISVEEAERVLADADSYLCVEVASARQRYGRLLAVVPPSSSFHERTSLEAYARLAATALDSAFALEQARRQAQAAEALLRLSRSLADLTSSAELAAKLTRAVPDVIDCDGAAVLLISDGVARVAAHYGCSPELADELDRQEFAGNELLQLLQLDRRTPEDMSPQGRALMETFGWQAIAAAPLEIDGETYGMLIASVRHDKARILNDEKLTDRFAGLAGQAAVALRNSQLMDQIRHQALHDPLTHIPNRTLLMERAEQMLADARSGDGTVAALFLDLDGFKEVNDTLGHDIGDGLLQAVAERLQSLVRDQDTVGRLGGDEFIVLVECGSMDTDVKDLADRLLRGIREPLMLPGCDRPIAVGASIGIAIGDRACAEDLLHDADMALHQAKASGKNCYRVFTSEIGASVVLRAELAGVAGHLAGHVSGHVSGHLSGHGELSIVYQPMVDLTTKAVVGVEALLRWDRDELGQVSPTTFVPLLEESGMIVDVGRWVLHEACREAAALRDAGHQLTMSVNASARQLECIEFVDDVRAALRDSGIPGDALVLEITETALMRDIHATRDVLTQLKQLGVGIAIDDFGTGYSSLAYLRDFPVDILKIARGFVAGGTHSAATRQLLSTFVELGRSLGLRTVAEGIETQAELQWLRHLGCDTGQGYLCSPPLSAHEVAGLLARGPAPALQVPPPRLAAWPDDRAPSLVVHAQDS
ncbi:MAG: hypothetical protein QOG99_444 [Frankiales bacterium]|nr:hypothetical protein [Frankiales bacterium]